MLSNSVLRRVGWSSVRSFLLRRRIFPDAPGPWVVARCSSPRRDGLSLNRRRPWPVRGARAWPLCNHPRCPGSFTTVAHCRLLCLLGGSAGMSKRAKIFWEAGLRTGRPCNVTERDPPYLSVRSLPNPRKSASSTGVRMLPRIRTPFLSESLRGGADLQNASRIRSDDQRVRESGRADLGLTVVPFPSPPHPR